MYSLPLLFPTKFELFIYLKLQIFSCDSLQQAILSLHFFAYCKGCTGHHTAYGALLAMDPTFDLVVFRVGRLFNIIENFFRTLLL